MHSVRCIITVTALVVSPNAVAAQSIDPGDCDALRAAMVTLTESAVAVSQLQADLMADTLVIVPVPAPPEHVAEQRTNRRVLDALGPEIDMQAVARGALLLQARCPS